MTKRPRNLCKVCGYKWYPRGHAISLACPKCKAKNVAVDWLYELLPIILGCIVLGTLLVYYAISMR